jgi:hypothetical protein
MSFGLEFMCMHDGLSELCMICDLWCQSCGWWLDKYICVLCFSELWWKISVLSLICMPCSSWMKGQFVMQYSHLKMLYMTFPFCHKNTYKPILQRTIRDDSYIIWRVSMDLTALMCGFTLRPNSMHKCGSYAILLWINVVLWYIYAINVV